MVNSLINVRTEFSKGLVLNFRAWLIFHGKEDVIESFMKSSRGRKPKTQKFVGQRTKN
jgi:hypothetical protein